uniref:Uncharacterized protein n=1 Tax=Nymphaea colorata TaxID=210225 RepID=A0A5K1HA92_9MAGN|nr:unnamed protein product [Nymphaea colorata]
MSRIFSEIKELKGFIAGKDAFIKPRFCPYKANILCHDSAWCV